MIENNFVFINELKKDFFINNDDEILNNDDLNIYKKIDLNYDNLNENKLLIKKKKLTDAQKRAQKNYYLKNKEKINEKYKECKKINSYNYYLKNKNKCNELSRNYYYNNSEKLKQQKKEKYKKKIDEELNNLLDRLKSINFESNNNIDLVKNVLKIIK